MSKKKKALLISMSAIIGIVAVCILYVYNTYEKMYVNEGNKKEDRRDASKYKEVKGISNILLVGVDARVDGEPTRSDALTILTIDDNHKKIKLTSILRDSYVKIPGHSEEKITHAYSYGEMSLLRKTIEENFNIRLDNYAIIDFNGFKAMIDAVGGIEVDVKNKAEVKELNRCIDIEVDDNPKLSKQDSVYLKEPGKQLLSGRQALAFSRMRKVGNGTFDRARRQREVIEVLINKFKDVSPMKYPSIANELLPYIKTNVPITDALNLAYTIQKIGNFNIEKLQIPTDKLSDGVIVSKAKGWVHVMDIEGNKKVMHDFIFEDKLYDEKLYTQFKYAGKVEKSNENTEEHEYDKPKTKKKVYIEDDGGNDKSQNNSNNDNSSGGSSNVTNKTTETPKTTKTPTPPTTKTPTSPTTPTTKTPTTTKENKTDTGETKQNTDVEQKKEGTSAESTKK